MAMTKKFIFCLWLLVVFLCVGVYLSNPELFQPENLRQLFTDNLFSASLVYLALGTLRGLTLVPLTPLLLAGVLVFPPFILLVINAIVIVTSSTIVYYWGRYLGFDQVFAQKYPEQLNKLSQSLKEKELLVCTLWSFFPLVPTDMICYASSVLRVRLWKCLAGVSLGENVICAVYIFGGNMLLTQLSSF